jgi:hypothetical protein
MPDTESLYPDIILQETGSDDLPGTREQFRLNRLIIKCGEKVFSLPSTQQHR